MQTCPYIIFVAHAWQIARSLLLPLPGCRNKKALAVGVVVACLVAYSFLQTPWGAPSKAGILAIGQYLAKVRTCG